MRHGWSAQHTSQHSIGDLRFARTRSARRPGSDARAAAALYATFASAILALRRARRGTRSRRGGGAPIHFSVGREARCGSKKIVRGSLQHLDGRRRARA